MLFLSKTNIEKKLSKRAKALLRVFCGSFALFAVVFFSDSLSAQIQNLYNNDNSEIAGINALMSAVANNDVNGVKFFSKAGSALINQKNLGGATSLHLACRESNFEIAEILVKNGADVNALDNEGWTPLMRAALAGNRDIVKMLMSGNADAGNLNSLGESVIIHAAISRCADCLNSIFEKVNLTKSMDVKILKEQLTDAFMIARNHEDEVTQGLLESYLDQVIKTAPLIGKEEFTAQKDAISAPQKIFKIVGEDATPTSKQPSPIIAKPSAVQQQPKALDEPQRYVYTPTKDESFDEKVVFLIKDLAGDDQKTLPGNFPGKNPAVETKSGNVVFKFNSGPQGIVNPQPTTKSKVCYKPKAAKQIAKQKVVKVISKKPEQKIIVPTPSAATNTATTIVEVKTKPVQKTEPKPEITTTTLIKMPTPAAAAPSVVEKPKELERKEEIVAPKASPSPTSQQVFEQKTEVKKSPPKYVIGVLPKE